MKNSRKWIALLLVLVLTVSLFVGCAKTEEPQKEEPAAQTTPPAAEPEKGKEPEAEKAPEESAPNADSTGYVVPEEPVVLNIYHCGAKPDGWDEVYAKYLEMTKDTLNIELNMIWNSWGDYTEKFKLEVTSGADIDLCFDASFLALKELAADGYYADLAEYFHNPEQYPGLAANFSEEAMKNNSWYGRMCYIPLYQSLATCYGVYYRADWAREWGIGTDGEINSWEEMEAYWQAAADHGVLAYAAAAGDGFYSLLTETLFSYPGKDGGPSTAQAGIQLVEAGGLNVWTYIKDGQLISYAVEGSGDEAFKDFPEGWQYDFGADRYDSYQKWYEAGYIGSDSLSPSDINLFAAGQAASVGEFLTTFVTMTNLVKAENPDAEVDFFIPVDDVRNKVPGSLATNFDAGNGLCVPVTSTKIPYTMKFLDWMFGSKEAHDLMMYGIEGRDFNYGEEEGTIETLTNYSSVFYGFTFCWNPNYIYYSTELSDKALDYHKWTADEANYTVLPAPLFKFDTSDIDLSTSIAQCKAVTDMANTVKKHGIPIDGYGNTYATCSEMVEANVAMAMENGGQEIVDAVVAQLQAHLAG